MTAVEIRRAGPDDALALAELFSSEAVARQLMQLPYPDVLAWRKRLETPAEPGRCDVNLAAFVAGKLVGAAGLHTAAPMVRRRHAMVLGICVAPAAQRQGVGAALMAALIDYADKWAGILRIELTVWADNEAALNLYRKFGFEIEGRHRAYGFRDGCYEDAIAMARLKP